MIKNIEIFFAENPDTPPKTTVSTKPEERNSNWNKRIKKAHEQSKIKPIPFSQVFAYVNDFLNVILNNKTGLNNKSPYILILDKNNQANNQAIILDNGIIVLSPNNWELPKWEENKKRYTKWDSKYDLIKEEFKLKYSSDIIWMKFTDKCHLGVVAKSFDINFEYGNTSGKLIKEVGENWDDSFVFIFPLTKEILSVYKKDDIERAIGNYLISKGVPIIDFYSHNY